MNFLDETGLQRLWGHIVNICNGKSNTDHNHDDKYVDIVGDTMTGVLKTPQINIQSSAPYTNPTFSNLATDHSLTSGILFSSNIFVDNIIQTNEISVTEDGHFYIRDGGAVFTFPLVDTSAFSNPATIITSCGGEIEGRLWMKDPAIWNGGNWPAINFFSADKVATGAINMDSTEERRHMYFTNKFRMVDGETNYTHAEVYHLPSIDSEEVTFTNSTVDYNILTTKTVKISSTEPENPTTGMLWFEI